MHREITEIEKLVLIVKKIRLALENPQVKKLYAGFNEFPAGSCMDSSILLGNLLMQQTMGSFKLVSAWHKQEYSHSWLENRTYIIDITADQFENWPQQPLVILKKPYPEHYKSLKIHWKRPLSRYPYIHDISYLMALKVVRSLLSEDGN